MFRIAQGIGIATHRRDKRLYRLNAERLCSLMDGISPGWKHYEEVAKIFGVELAKVGSHKNNKIIVFVVDDDKDKRKIYLSLASAQHAR